MPKARRTSTIKAKSHPEADILRKSSAPKRKRTEMRVENVALVSKRIVRELEKLFVRRKNDSDAKDMRRYMRNQFNFYGIKTPERKNIAKEYFSINAKPSSLEILATVKLLWGRDQREFQYCAVDLLQKNQANLAADADICLQSTDVVKGLLTEKSWWDTVDLLATNVIGHFAKMHPDQLNPVIEEWIKSDDMWLRRTAILHQLKFKGNTDQIKLFRYCLQCSSENEFFIQKAIGWALREYHKTEPQAVKDFVAKHNNTLAKLSVREALKHVTKL